MFSIDASAFLTWLRRFGEEVPRSAAASLDQVADTALTHAQQTTKFKDRTHALRGSLRKLPSGPFRILVVANAYHALFVEEDTKPHTITAHGRALRFVVAGKTLFRRSVKHPGTTGTHFMRDARDEAESKLHGFVEDGLDRLIAA